MAEPELLADVLERVLMDMSAPEYACTLVPSLRSHAEIVEKKTNSCGLPKTDRDGTK